MSLKKILTWLLEFATIVELLTPPFQKLDILMIVGQASLRTLYVIFPEQKYHADV